MPMDESRKTRSKSSPRRDRKVREHFKGGEETVEAGRGDTLDPLRRHSDPVRKQSGTSEETVWANRFRSRCWLQARRTEFIPGR